MLNQWWKLLCYYVRSDKIGTIILLCCFSLVLIIYSVWPQSTPEMVNKEQFNADYELFLEMTSPKPIIIDFTFDINTVKRDTLDLLQLPKYVVNNWQNYLQKGGRFSRISDLKKIYGFNDSLFAIVSKYAKVSVKLKSKEKTKTKFSSSISKTKKKKASVIVKKKLAKIELNAADSVALLKLKGIGAVLAKRIIKYRKFLGGFYSVNQLHEVYGLKPEVVEKNIQRLWVDTTLIQKININFATQWELARHPYITKTEARKIINYRSTKGKISSLKTFNADSSLILKKASQWLHYVTL